jgi:histidine ammonia-lyase
VGLWHQWITISIVLLDNIGLVLRGVNPEPPRCIIGLHWAIAEPPSPPLELAGHGLTPADVADVARRGRRVEIAPPVRERMAESRAALDRALAEERPVYGLTTGLGARVVEAVAPDRAAEQSARIVRGRAAAVGEPLPAASVRAAMLARLNGLCAGGSGASPHVAELLAEMLNAGVHPVVPRSGSIGSGDLCLLAHVGLVVMGEGEAELGGDRLTGAEALRRAGLEPAALGPGDGLALVSSPAVAAGVAALALDAAEGLLETLAIATALSMEGFRASPSPIDANVAGAHPAPGQEWEAAGLRELLRGGTLLEGRGRRLQDPLSFRCASHVHGALRWALDVLATAVAATINGAGENPLVLASGEVVSTGNFHTPALALALDTCAIAFAQAAGPASERPARLANERLSGLPANLSRAGDGRSGVAPLLKTSQSLAVDIRHLAAPLAADPRFGADGVEDDSTNAAAAALRLERQLGLLERVVAVELVCATLAVDLATPERMGRGTTAAHACVRELVEPLDDDRPLGADVERVARELVASGGLRERIREAVRWQESS